MIPDTIPQTDPEADVLVKHIADCLIKLTSSNLGVTREDLIEADFNPDDIDRHFPAARRIANARLTRDVNADMDPGEPEPTPQKQVYAYQDGADFYFSYTQSKPGSGGTLMVVTAPLKVLDFDMPAAKRAREWFENNHGPVVWEPILHAHEEQPAQERPEPPSAP